MILEHIIIIILSCYLLSTSMFIFWVVKGGFNRNFLYSDNLILGTISSLIIIPITYSFPLIPLYIVTPFISGFLILFLFILLFLFRFFRNPKRLIPGDSNDFVSPADGRIIYIKELEENQIPVTVKKKQIANISEITKTEILKQPCYLIGIAITLFDVHYNRSPIDGELILIQHTPGTSIGLNTPESTLTNERMTSVIQRKDGVMVGVVQIAARGVNRCIVLNNNGDSLVRGQIFGKIRWGSQTDLVIPRNCEILVREGEQVYAGKTIIGKLI